MLSLHDVGSLGMAESSEDHLSLSPPFIQCVTISPNGILAASTADGRLVLGFGSTKHSKKQKRWEGLRSDEMVDVKVADGPVVSLYADASSFFGNADLVQEMAR